MHIKAIQIKEQLLGHEDYEVALSVGHLASLYNYDMNQYEDAERLYLRSIAIGQSQGRDGWDTIAGCHFFIVLCSLNQKNRPFPFHFIVNSVGLSMVGSCRNNILFFLMRC